MTAGKAIRIHQHGGPEVLSLEDMVFAAPATGEIQVRHTAIGLNFIDVYFRTGLYPAPGGLPFTPGSEGAGVVEIVGEGVSGFQPGDRVAYAFTPGSYATHRNIAANRVVKIPDEISDSIHPHARAPIPSAPRRACFPAERYSAYSGKHVRRRKRRVFYQSVPGNFLSAHKGQETVFG